MFFAAGSYKHGRRVGSVKFDLCIWAESGSNNCL